MDANPDKSEPIGVVRGNQDSQWGNLAGALYCIKGACALHSVFGLLVGNCVNKELLYLDRLQTALLNTISNRGVGIHDLWGEVERVGHV